MTRSRKWISHLNDNMLSDFTPAACFRFIASPEIITSSRQVKCQVDIWRLKCQLDISFDMKHINTQGKKKNWPHKHGCTELSIRLQLCTSGAWDRSDIVEFHSEIISSQMPLQNSWWTPWVAFTVPSSCVANAFDSCQNTCRVVRPDRIHTYHSYWSVRTVRTAEQ